MPRRARTTPDSAATNVASAHDAPASTLLPIVAAQAVALWAALRGSLAYLDYQLLVIAELLLVQLSLVVLATPRRRRERLATFATTAFGAAPGLLLFNALLAPIATLPEEQIGTPFALVADALARLSGEGLRYAFGYLVASFGIAALQARLAEEPLRTWSDRIAGDSGTNSGAMLLGIFALAPVIIARKEIDAVGAIDARTMDAALVVMMIVLRLALSIARERMAARGRVEPARGLAASARRRTPRRRTRRA